MSQELEQKEPKGKEVREVQFWTSKGWTSEDSDKIDIFFNALAVIGIVLQAISVACFFASIVITYRNVF